MHAGGTQRAKSIKAYSWHSQNQSSTIKVLLWDLLMKDNLRFGLVSSDRLDIFRVMNFLYYIKNHLGLDHFKFLVVWGFIPIWVA